LEQEGAALAVRLRDPDACEISWVTLPEPMALEETSDAIDALERAGIHVSRLIVNRVTPTTPAARKPRGGEGGCKWCEARRRFEARALAPVARRFRGREILMLPDFGIEPRGAAALRTAANALRRFEAPSPRPPVDRRMRATLDTGSVACAFGRKDPISDLTGDAHWLLFGGKGGVGKSTCAAAVALRLAQSRKVLLLSTDPAHSIGDVLGARFDNTPRPAPDAPSLHVREIDAATEMD